LVKAAVFIAPCGENNPIELYFLKEGYPYNCRQCGKAATYKMLFLSPKHEVEGAFGPAYFCQGCVPDVDQVANNSDSYFDILFGV
ncbi:MAG: hypothetical protein ACOY0S_03810, partial [Patescibacteria group bacterium]